MKWKRYYHWIRLCMIFGAAKRAEYCRRKGIFASMGKDCRMQGRKIPLYPGLIRIGNNVKMASNVSFITHDIIHSMLNSMNDGTVYCEKKGCIEVGDNVFIGANVSVLYDVKIGSNVIIAANSLVNKDVPDNVVAGGSPCRVLGDFESFVKRRREESKDGSISDAGLFEHFDGKHKRDGKIEREKR